MANFYNRKEAKGIFGFASTKIITRELNALLIWNMVEVWNRGGWPLRDTELER